MSAATPDASRLTLEEVHTLAVQDSATDLRSILSAKEVRDSLQLRGRLKLALRCIAHVDAVAAAELGPNTQPDLRRFSMYASRTEEDVYSACKVAAHSPRVHLRVPLAAGAFDAPRNRCFFPSHQDSYFNSATDDVQRPSVQSPTRRHDALPTPLPLSWRFAEHDRGRKRRTRPKPILTRFLDCQLYHFTTVFAATHWASTTEVASGGGGMVDDV